VRPLSAIADDDPITHRGIVYFIGSGDAIKIGYSTDLQKRIADLKTGAAADIELLDYARAGRDVERELHSILASERIRGEWFKASDKTEDIMDLISDFLDDEFSDEDDRCLDGRDAHILMVAELRRVAANPYFWRADD
jgi:hypothetical protein